MNIIAVGVEFIDLFAKMKSLMSLVYVKFNRNKTGLITYPVNGREVLLKSRMRDDEMHYQRAVQCYLYFMPISSFGAIRDAFREIGVDNNTLIVAEKSWEPKNVFLIGLRSFSNQKKQHGI